MQPVHFNAHQQKTKFFLVSTVFIAILLFCSCGTTGTSSTISAAPTNQITKTTPTAVKPKPTSTATIPSNTGPAVLGGSLAAFVAKFGQPNNHSSNGQPHFERCGNSNTDQLILSQISLENVSGPITSIVVASCSSSWNMSQATAACSSFFPLDAQYQRSVQIPGSQSQFANVDKIYYSAALAQTFAADNLW